MGSAETIFDPDGDIVLILNGQPTGMGLSADCKTEDGANVTPEKAKSTTPNISPLLGPIQSPTKNIPHTDHTLTAVTIKTNMQKEYRFRVSSKHLMLASRVFKSMLQPSFMEGLALATQGYLELPLPDDEPGAFSILLKLVHAKFRDVPRYVDLPSLTHIAILVDKYELLELIWFNAGDWVSSLGTYIPTSFTADLLPWISISWVFKDNEIFQKMTEVAQWDSQGLLDVHDLPIPSNVLR